MIEFFLYLLTAIIVFSLLDHKGRFYVFVFFLYLSAYILALIFVPIICYFVAIGYITVALKNAVNDIPNKYSKNNPRQDF